MSQNNHTIDNIPLFEWDTSVVLQFLTNQKIKDKKVHESMFENVLIKCVEDETSFKKIRVMTKIVLKTQKINGALLGPMTLDDFKRLGVPVGFANSIVKKVASLKEFQEKYLDTTFHEKEDLITDTTNESMKSVSISSTEYSEVVPCVAWDENQFSSEQLQAFEFCMQKLDFFPETTSVNSKYKTTICQNLTFPDRFMYEYLNPQRLENYKKRTTPGTSNESIMKVRLAVTEMSEDTQHRFIRKFGSIVGLASDTIYGLFHTALIVGPWYLEWGDIVIVRNRSASKAIFVANVGEIKGTNKVKKLQLLPSFVLIGMEQKCMIEQTVMLNILLKLPLKH